MSGWGIRLIIRLIGFLIALMAVSILPVSLYYQMLLLLFGGILVMLS